MARRALHVGAALHAAGVVAAAGVMQTLQITESAGSSLQVNRHDCNVSLADVFATKLGVCSVAAAAGDVELVPLTVCA